jgi:hypothetical protein
LTNALTADDSHPPKLDEFVMEPLDLPILPTGDEGTFIVLLPGLDRSSMKKCDYEIDEEEDLLTIQCYYGGFTEENEVDGVTYPVRLNDERRERLESHERLLPMNPLEVNLEDYFDTEEAKKLRLFFKQLENKYGRSLDNGDNE